MPYNFCQPSSSALVTGLQPWQLGSALVILDPQVQDYERLLLDLDASTSIAVLDSEREGVTQIAELLARHSSVTQVHLVSHGAPGCLYLGNGELSLDNLEAAGDQLKTWFAEFGQRPSLLIYGCNVAAGDAGAEFLDQLQQLTGAAIAASKTRTGNAEQGGDWNLEVTRGNPDLTPAFSLEVQANYAGILAPINAGDYAALKALYLQTGGSSWSNNTGWRDWNFNSTTPPDTTVVAGWYGVTVNSSGRIVSLDFRPSGQGSGYNNLAGAIPSEIGNLTALETLIANDNRLTSLPSELGNMTQLKDLRLQNNDLVGQIPRSLGQLQNLQNLFLNVNELSGPIPSELGNLSSVFWMDLSNNKLTGAVPKELGNAPNLRRVYLYSNELSGSIPSELLSLPLQDLRLDNNRLTGTIPAAIANSNNLQTLDLSRNNLVGPLPSALAAKISGNAGLAGSTNLNNPLSLRDELTGVTIGRTVPSKDVIVNISDLDKAGDNLASSSVRLTVDSSSNPGLIDVGDITILGPGNSDLNNPQRTIRITPKAGQTGTATITLRLSNPTDGDPNSFGPNSDFDQLKTFQVTVGDLPPSSLNLSLSSVRTVLPENINVNQSNFIATVSLTQAQATIALAGTDANLFEVVPNSNGSANRELRLKSGISPLSFANKSQLSVTLNADELDAGLSIDDSETLTIKLVATPDDFNRNGGSDRVWRNTATGENVVSALVPNNLPGAATTTFVNPVIRDANWQIQAIGNFNQDGIGDFVWRNIKTGQNLVWLMEGGTPGQNPRPSGSVALDPVTDRRWGIKGAGDFNQDGKSDLLWYNPEGAAGQQIAVWYMDGTTKTSSSLVNPGFSSSAKLEGTGDFDGDGKADLLSSLGNGKYQITFLEPNQTSVIVDATVSGFPEVVQATGYAVAGIGDYDRDGYDDIAFRSADGRNNEIWKIRGTSRLSSTSVTTPDLPGASWQPTI